MIELAPDQLSTGTTIIAVEFAEGVVIAADSRTSCNVVVANRLADKLTKLTDHIYCCRCGSAADTQKVCHQVRFEMDLLAANLGRAVLVKDAACAIRNILFDADETMLAAFLIAGWDDVLGGQVYSTQRSGMLLREKCSVGGSGSTYIQGYVTANYRLNMSKKDCVEFVTNAVKLAMQLDNFSGGLVRIGIITKDGIEMLIDYKTEQLRDVTNRALFDLQFAKQS